jgi:hypothetical protein
MYLTAVLAYIEKKELRVINYGFLKDLFATDIKLQWKKEDSRKYQNNTTRASQMKTLNIFYLVIY